MSQPGELEVGGGTGGVVLPASGDGTPRHGFRGESGRGREAPAVALGLTITVSREAGARGGTIARRVGEQLGWQVYDQELLEYTAQNPVIRQGLTDGLPQPCVEWLERRLAQLQRQCPLDRNADVLHLVRVVLALGAHGQVVLIGRGAGCILPAETTLNVRIVAPLTDRVAYLGQALRLSSGEAADHVRQRDERRAEFVTTHFGRPPEEVHQYAMILNSTLLGEEGCVALIAQAARLRLTSEASG